MLYLFNTTIMPNEGVFSCKKITLERAKELYSKAKGITSALGHQGSADAFTALGMPADVNRIQATMNTGDKAICLKVLGRIAEGQILTIDELNKIGFEFYEVNMLADSMQMLEDQASYEGAAPINGHIWPL